MDILIIALTIGLPLIKFLLFPARAMGRGGNWTIYGAMMIVGVMMVIWLGVRSLGDPSPPSPASPAAAQASTSSDAAAAVEKSELAALQKLL